MSRLSQLHSGVHSDETIESIGAQCSNDSFEARLSKRTILPQTSETSTPCLSETRVVSSFQTKARDIITPTRAMALSLNLANARSAGRSVLRGGEAASPVDNHELPRMSRDDGSPHRTLSVCKAEQLEKATCHFRAPEAVGSPMWLTIKKPWETTQEPR